MTTVWTYFDTVWASVGEECRGDVGEFLEWLVKACASPLVTPNKATLPLWAPVCFEGNRRALSGVKGVYALCYDYDQDAPLTEVGSVWAEYTHVRHTTYSEGATEKGGEPCAARRVSRVVVPLARPVTRDEYAQLWSMGYVRGTMAGLMADRAARDPSRGWFPPAHHPDRAPPQYQSVLARTLDPDTWLSQPQLPILTGCATPTLVTPAPEAAPTEHRAPGPGHRSPPGALELALREADRLPPSISGQGGDAALFHAACVLRRGYCLTEGDAHQALVRYNLRSQPAWPDTKLRREARMAAKTTYPEWGACLPAPGPTPATASGKRGGEVRFADLVTHVSEARPALHFDEFLAGPRDGEGGIDDAYVLRLRAELSTVGVEARTADVWEATLHAARTRTRNSLTEHLSGLAHDGVGRLGAVATTYLGVSAAEQPLADTLVRRWMLSCVARAYEPGCQADSVLVLQGAQGVGKTTFFRVLAGPGRYLSLDDVGSKDTFVSLSGIWLAELEEIDKLAGRRDAATVKAFLSQMVDTFRAPYARTSVTRPRSYAFGATTNRLEFLYDPTGARRFWPVVVGQVDVPALCRDRDQLWAEAVTAYRQGQEWHLTAEERAGLAVRHDLHGEVDEWTSLLADRLRHVPHGPGQGLKLADVARAALSLEGARLDLSVQRRVGACLRTLGYDKRQVVGQGWMWFKK